MENDCESHGLPPGLFDQSVSYRCQHLWAHPLGLCAPRGIGSLVHVAVRAVHVAPACSLYENRVELALSVGPTASASRAIYPDCDGCGRGHMQPLRVFHFGPRLADGIGPGAR